MFQTPLTIKQVIAEINRQYFLPSIQREFVWDEYQIIKLFDSILTGYPIGSFLFWRTNKSNIAKFKFYEFLRDFHQIKNKHNTKANLAGFSEIQAVLDGQQRLTSIYIGLRGSYSTKKPYAQWNNPNSYPTRKLYLNLNESNINNEDIEIETQYKFAFLTAEDITEEWFEVGKILDMSFVDVTSFVQKNNLNPTAQNVLSNLYEYVCVKPLLNYYLETSNELHKVLNIFIRVNSGGTVLSYSDLLLSIATASWKDVDAREEIHKFVDEINSIGFSINDFCIN